MLNSAPKDLSACRAFFLAPHSPKQRIYEALRAYFVDGRPANVSAGLKGSHFGRNRMTPFLNKTICGEAVRKLYRISI